MKAKKNQSKKYYWMNEDVVPVPVAPIKFPDTFCLENCSKLGMCRDRPIFIIECRDRRRELL